MVGEEVSELSVTVVHSYLLFDYDVSSAGRLLLPCLGERFLLFFISVNFLKFFVTTLVFFEFYRCLTAQNCDTLMLMCYYYHQSY